jgi:hypothetical protein
MVVCNPSASSEAFTSTRRKIMKARILFGIVTLGLLCQGAIVPAQEQGPNAGPVVTGYGRAFPTFWSQTWAVINADGTIARNAGNAVSSGKAADCFTAGGPGCYEVIFDDDVTGCAYIGTITNPPDAGTQPTGEITTVRRGSNPNGVFVTTHNSSGAPSDRAFALVVTCYAL